MATPLTNLTRKGVPFVWSSIYQSSFELIRGSLHRRPLLLHPNSSRPYVVYTDASVTGIGGVLCQDAGEGL